MPLPAVQVESAMELKHVEIERRETDKGVRNRTSDIETSDEETEEDLDPDILS